MIIFRKAADLADFLLKKRNEKCSVGFVPTMGALHAGHLSLVTKSLAENDWTVVSIFVNPTQFNNAADLEKYPRNTPLDIELLHDAGCPVLFLPDENEMYPDGNKLSEQYPLGPLDSMLEGEFRPGHFQGVCQVVHRLLKMVGECRLYLGKKDFQQVMVLKKLTELEKLPAEIIACESVREPGGLAMSSRNARLTAEGKNKAATISKVLFWMKEFFTTDFDSAQQSAQQQGIEKLTAAGIAVEYLEVRRSADLLLPHAPDDPLVILAACTVEGVRLIDAVEV